MDFICIGIQFTLMAIVFFFIIKQNDRIITLTKKLKKIDKQVKNIGEKKPTLDDVSNDVNELFKKIEDVKKYSNDSNDNYY